MPEIENAWIQFLEDLGCETLAIRDGAPLSITNQVQRTLVYERGAWHIRIDTNSKLTADATNFYGSLGFDGAR